MVELSVYDLTRDIDYCDDLNLCFNSFMKLIRLIKDGFLTLNREDILYAINYLDNSKFINDIIDGKYGYNEYIRSFIIKYINGIIPLKIFVKRSIRDDIVINALLSFKFRDLDLFYYFICDFDFNYLLEIFDNDIDRLIDFILNIDSISDSVKENTIKYIIYNYLIDNEEFFDKLYIIFKYKNNAIIKRICDKNFLERFNNSVMKNGTVNKELMEYIIKNSYSDDNIRDNYRVLYGDKDYLEYDKCTELLNSYFEGTIILDKDSMKDIIRGIMTYYLNSNGICDVMILFNNDNKRGSFNISNNLKYIYINVCLIDSFLDDDLSFASRIRLFNTMFHEMRHAVQYCNIRYGNIDYDYYIMLKEDIIRFLGDTFYYSINYRINSSEIDARKHGFLDSMEFLYSSFPSISDRLDSIKHFPFYEYEDYHIKCFSITESIIDFEDLFDRIVLLNPDIIKKYPILEIEYNRDGTLKSLGELFNNIDNNIVRGILSKRYRYNDILDSIMYRCRRR